MKPNTQFELSVRDIDLIEIALHKQISRLVEQRLTHIQSTIVPEHQLERVKEIDAEVKEIRDLLGRLHHQKEWYRPKSETYVGG